MLLACKSMMVAKGITQAYLCQCFPMLEHLHRLDPVVIPVSPAVSLEVTLSEMSWPSHVYPQAALPHNTLAFSIVDLLPKS